MSQSTNPREDQRSAILSELFVYPPTGHARLHSWLPTEIARYLPAISCVLLPLIILFIYQITVQELKTTVSIKQTYIIGPDCPASDRQKAADSDKVPSLALQTLSMNGSDVSGRYGFTTSSAVLRVLSLVGMGFALFFIFRRTRPVEGVITSIISVGIALFLADQLSLHREEGTRRTLVDPIMEAAATAHVFNLAKEVDVMVSQNIYFGITAVVVMLCALGVVAIRARDQELTPAILRKRLSDFKWAMIFMATILVMTVIITRVLIDWQLSFLCESYRNGLKSAAAALANYWGTGSSVVLLGALLPSYFSWSRDVARWATIRNQMRVKKSGYR